MGFWYCRFQIWSYIYRKSTFFKHISSNGRNKSHVEILSFISIVKIIFKFWIQSYYHFLNTIYEEWLPKEGVTLTLETYWVREKERESTRCAFPSYRIDITQRSSDSCKINFWVSLKLWEKIVSGIGKNAFWEHRNSIWPWNSIIIDELSKNYESSYSN